MKLLIQALKSLTRISLAVIVFYASFTYVTKLINYPYQDASETAELTRVETSNETTTRVLPRTELDRQTDEKQEPEFKILPVPEPKREKIVLGKQNSIVFRDVVTNQSTSLLLYEIIKMDAKLKKGEPIYLVLDTPGGSVVAGNGLIDALQALGRPVHTISLFAASMGYHMVQSLDKRYITPSGTLMSHRVRIGGLSGQVPGEATVRMADILRTSYLMDKKVAERLNMPLKQYQNMIRDEYWVNGSDAVMQNSSDKIADVKCGMDLTGTYERTMMTFFGPIKLVWSQCALIRYPLEVDFSGLWIFEEQDAEEASALSPRLLETIGHNRHLIKNFMTLYTYDRQEFVRQYIMTGKYEDILMVK